MPYTGPGDKSLPDYVKKLSKAKRKQWANIFNSVHKKCIADGGKAKKCESFAFKNANGVVIKKGKKKSMDDLKTIFNGILRVFADALRVEQPKKKERDMGMSRLREQVWVLLRREESWSYLLDVYRSDAGELYVVLVSDGKLYRQSITIDGETVTLSEERVQVGELFPPIERAALTITRQADGELRWTMIAATAVVNRVGEIDSTELFENLAAHAEEPDVPHPYLTFYHCGEKLRLGSIDYLARDGYVYINSGLLDQDNALAMAIARDSASGEWGGSIHYDPIGDPERVEVASDIFIPVYRDGIHIETSIVLEDSAAALFTILGANKEVLRMDQKVKDKLQELLGDDAEQWVALADEVNRKIDEEGYVARTQEGGKPAPKDPTPTQDGPPQEPKPATQPPVVDQTLELDEEAVGIIVRGVAESDAFKGQFAALDTSLTTLNGTLETLTKQLESNAASSTEALVKVRERLDALEKDEEQKQREWLEDVPQRQKLRVTYRPSRDNAPGGVRQPAGTLADVADATLANMPSMS